MSRTDPLAARIRAARAYKGLTLKAAGEMIDVSSRQFSRYEAGDWKKEPPSRDQLDAIADGCGVPRAFIHAGWNIIDEQPTVAERLEALDAQIGAVVSAFSAIRRGDPLDQTVAVLQQATEAGREKQREREASVVDATSRDRQRRAAGGDDA